ncbi:MAG: cell division protein ZapA [Deltaproteobacteria bacterium]|nr:cell division protein ZapA [Deltaproteobacteria bacterium]
MNSIEIAIAGQKYILSGEETPEHLNEVSELVRRRVESIRKKNPGLSLQKATMLVAFDFASETIKRSPWPSIAMAPSPKAQYRKLPDSLIPKGDLRDKLSSQIVTTIAELPIVIRANHLATFASREHEPDLRGLWERFRSACTFPKILGDEIRFFPISRWEDLRPGPLGILEPPEHTAPTVFQERDVILVPGKCFGPQGERIGSGKGYFTPLHHHQDRRSVGLSVQPIAAPTGTFRYQNRPSLHRTRNASRGLRI